MTAMTQEWQWCMQWSNPWKKWKELLRSREMSKNPELLEDMNLGCTTWWNSNQRGIFERFGILQGWKMPDWQENPPLVIHCRMKTSSSSPLSLCRTTRKQVPEEDDRRERIQSDRWERGFGTEQKLLTYSQVRENREGAKKTLKVGLKFKKGRGAIQISFRVAGWMVRLFDVYWKEAGGPMQRLGLHS